MSRESLGAPPGHSTDGSSGIRFFKSASKLTGYSIAACLSCHRDKASVKSQSCGWKELMKPTLREMALFNASRQSHGLWIFHSGQGDTKSGTRIMSGPRRNKTRAVGPAALAEAHSPRSSGEASLFHWNKIILWRCRGTDAPSWPKEMDQSGYSKLPADSITIFTSPSDWRNTFPH